MANFRFFNIGKANEEIARLETENVKLAAQVSALATNDGEALKAAESRIVTLEASASESLASIAAITSERDKAVSESAAFAVAMKDLNAKLEAKAGEVDATAARKALEIQAGLGHPAKPSTESATPTTSTELTGLARVTAAFKNHTKTA